MTDPSKLRELAGRCEKAEGPSFALEMSIFHAVYPDADRLRPPNNYTASLDAAMTLMKPGALLAVGSMEEGPFARVCWPQPNGTYIDGYYECLAAATPALALCAAALRAIASEADAQDAG